MAQEGLEPSASLVLSESGLPIAYRAENVAPITQYPGWESNPQAPGLKPGRSAVGVPGPREAEAVELEPTSGPRPPPVFKTGPSSGRMASFSRVPGAGIEPAASAFRARRHDQQQLPRSSGRRIRTPPA